MICAIKGVGLSMHSANMAAALLAVALSTAGCMHGMNMMNVLTLGLLGNPLPSQGETIAHDTTSAQITNNTYVTNNYYGVSSTSTGTGRAPRAHHSHKRY